VIAAIHQPHFLPWLGYWNKLLHSEAFVLLDTVQYRKNYFQNRAEIRLPGGGRGWLTVPVHASLGTSIRDVVVAESGWKDRLEKTVVQAFVRAPHFKECWPPIAAALRSASDRLAEVNRRTIEAVLGLLGEPRPRLSTSAEMSLSSEDPTDRLVEICRILGADAYLSGRGGRRYLRESAFQDAGIRIIWQDFQPEKASYPQRGVAEFLPGLSVLDSLFEIGPEATRKVALDAWAP
jgi:hypothetical protein